MKGIILLWSKYTSVEFPNAISIPGLIEKDSDQLRSQYLEWVYNFGESIIDGQRIIDHFIIRPNLSYWWLSRIAEKNNWEKSPYVSDVIKLFFLKKWINNRNIRLITLVSPNIELGKSLKIWGKENQVQVNHQYTHKLVGSKNWVKTLYRIFPEVLKGFIWLAYIYFKALPLKNEGLDSWIKTKGDILFISYLFQTEMKIDNFDGFKSPYWTKLPQVLKEKKVKTNWLHIFIEDSFIPDTKSASKALKNFNKMSQNLENHITLWNFISLKIVVQTLRDWFKIYRKGLEITYKIEDKSHFKFLWPLFRKDWNSSIFGQVAVSNLLFLNLFDKALFYLPPQKKGIYLQENQAWEFAMLSAWKNNGHREIIGFPHTTVRFWDLSYFIDKRIFLNTKNFMPSPEKVACSGETILEVYKNCGYPTSQLVEVEALRYLYLRSYSKDKPQKKNIEIRILIAGDYSQKKTDRLLKMLQNTLPLISKKISFIFKPHPACQLSLTKYHSLNLTVEKKSLSVLWNDCDLIICSSNTSAAIDAYLAGQNLISHLDGSSLNLSPLRGIEFANFISNAKELAHIIKNLKGQKKIEKNRINYFYLDNNLTKWKRILLE
jgi:surface carbohydrate biosynthesis protein (TIGR04326 family)